MSKEKQKPKYGSILEWLADLEDRVGRLEEERKGGRSEE